MPASITPSTSMLQLVPFMQKKGEEVPDFTTVYYDRATKRIMRRTEKKIEAKGMTSKMISDKAVMVGTDVDPRFTISVGKAAIHASEDNIDRMMNEIESTKKTSSQLKDTLRKEREEGNKLKRKYDHVLREMEDTKSEIYAIQVAAHAQETTHEALERAQQEILDLKNEREQMRAKIEDLEEQQNII